MNSPKGKPDHAEGVNLYGDLKSFDTLVLIIALLRSPKGCPWDREQTHASLKPNLLEECYEVIEALDSTGVVKKGDGSLLCEELGDLLMQIVLHAQIAAEEGSFDIGDVIAGIGAKLIHRHPHVFADVEVKDAHEVSANWELLKREEKGKGSILAGLPRGMPSLAYSQAMQQRAARVGFDWKEMGDIIGKLSEEIEELQQSESHEEMVEEFGDVIFTLVNIARRSEIDLEESLRLVNEKFRRRFQYMEQLCSERGLSLDMLVLEEQDALWDEAKHHT